MHFLTTAFFLSLPIAAFAGSFNSGFPSHGHAAHHRRSTLKSRSNCGARNVVKSSGAHNTSSTASTQASSSSSADSAHATTNSSSGAIGVQGSGGYTLKELHQGKNFFDGWNFFNKGDPTHGLVNYLDQASATTNNLAYVDSNGVAVLAVDSTTHLRPGANRNSVRIHSKNTFSSGLFIADIAAMPTGCGTWPAWWSDGPNNPTGGEIDIIEGVNLDTTNHYTVHSSPGCTLDAAAGKRLATAQVEHTVCANVGASHAGCSFQDTDARSYGKGFNAVGGGVYATLWGKDGISIWHFARDAIPADINAKNPNPAGWGTASAHWAASSCDVSQHFYDHTLIFDTTLCGSWAGGSYGSSGCPATCEDAVADPSNFVDAKWKINYVAVYN